MDFKTFVDETILYLVQPVVDLMFAGAIFFFLWGVFGVIIKSDQPNERAKMKSRVMWGVFAIAIMASVWGLVSLVLNSTGLDTTTSIHVRINE